MSNKLKLANTKVIEYRYIKVIKFYNTDIVTIEEDQITLKTGGFLTQSTIKRMNQVAQFFNLPFMVSRAKGQLIVNTAKTAHLVNDNEFIIKLA